MVCSAADETATSIEKFILSIAQSMEEISYVLYV